MSVQRIISATTEEAAEVCAKHILGLLEAARSGPIGATLAISGGSSPKLMFAKIAASQFDWTNVHVFWVDKRCVPPADSQSNYKMAMENLIVPAGIPAAQVHRIFGELEPRQSAARYADDLSRFFKIGSGELPKFDVVHRGTGPDAHTASLFPGDPLIDDRQGIAAATFAPQFNQWRVTLLPGVLLAAKHTAVYAPGADKAEALSHVFGDEYDPKKYPSQLGLRGDNDVTWFLT